MGYREDSPLDIYQIFTSQKEPSEPPIVFETSKNGLYIYISLNRQFSPLVREQIGSGLISKLI